MFGVPVDGTASMFCDNQGIVWVATGGEKTALIRFDLQEMKAADDAHDGVGKGLPPCHE